MKYDKIKTAWNAQADEFNQWCELGEDEKVEWAARFGAITERAARQPPEAMQSNDWQHASATAACWCETCDTAANGWRTKMALCPQCGNKRCPRATHHDNACTGSNELGQKGSSWERASRKKAQEEVVVLKERIARSGVEHRRARAAPLTDEALDAMRQADNGQLNFVSLKEFRIIARAVERAHGIHPDTP